MARMPTGDIVYLLTGVAFIPFDKNCTNYTQLPPDIVKFVDGLIKLLTTQGFYYSYHTDLTSSQQRQASVKFKTDIGLTDCSYKFREEFQDKRYFWNCKIVQDFVLQNIDPFWTIPII